MDIARALSMALEAARQEAGTSQNDLADATDIPRATLQRVLRGRSPVRSDHFVRIATALGSTPTAVWARAETIAAGRPDPAVTVNDAIAELAFCHGVPERVERLAHGLAPEAVA